MARTAVRAGRVPSSPPADRPRRREHSGVAQAPTAHVSTLRLLADQVHYVNRSFWRTPIAAFFTIAFPLTFLVIVCSVVGNETIDARRGITVAQFLVPVFAVFGVAMASFCSLAIGVAEARETGVLKRLLGTPVPPWVQVAGRIVSAIWISMVAVLVLTAVGVLAYDVQIVWSKLPALLVTLLLGIACFAALGLAVTSLVDSASAVTAITTAILMPLAFISDVFGFGEMPGWLSTIGWLFPLRHMANAVADDFNPYLPGSGFYADHLAVLVAWGLVGLLITLVFFRWEPRSGHARPSAGTGKAHAAGRAVHAAVPVNVSGAVAARIAGTAGPRAVDVPGRPSGPALWAVQARFSTTMLWRDRSSSFFSVAFPLILMLFFAVAYQGATYRGVSLTQYAAAAFAVYGIAVATYVNVPQLVASAMERGVLKRLQGTPLPLSAFVVGWIAAAGVMSAVTVVAVFAVGIVALDVVLTWQALLPMTVAFILGTACFTALGLALAFVARSPRTVSAVALGTLLPLSFVSEIFMLGTALPTFLSAVGWAFPLRHFVHAAFEATQPADLDLTQWTLHLTVIVAWGIAGALLAWIAFRRQSRAGHKG